jgi:hypothetical protein
MIFAGLCTIIFFAMITITANELLHPWLGETATQGLLKSYPPQHRHRVLAGDRRVGNDGPDLFTPSD